MRNILKAVIVIVSMSHFICDASAMIDLLRYSKKVYKPVALVDNIIITENDVQQKMSIMRMSGADVSRDVALENIIDEMVIICAGQDKKISDEFIAFTIKGLANASGLNDDAFNKMLLKFGVEKDYLKQQVKAQIIWNEMMGDAMKIISKKTSVKNLYKNLAITKSQVHNNDDIMMRPAVKYKFTRNSRVKIAEILVSQKNQKNFEEIMELIKSNSEFAIIKEKFPNDVDMVSNDGVIGWLNFNEMSKEYKAVISNCFIGQIADPLVLGDKFLFIRLLDMQNVTQSKKFLNKDYLNLSYDQKSEMMLTNIQTKLYADHLINKLKKQFFVKIF